eukprot:6204454-Pleurochrysis_carterae.AAC.2
MTQPAYRTLHAHFFFSTFGGTGQNCYCQLQETVIGGRCFANTPPSRAVASVGGRHNRGCMAGTL